MSIRYVKPDGRESKSQRYSPAPVAWGSRPTGDPEPISLRSRLTWM
jgi:hypothetical protein